ncbi:MAG: ABC transporter substrate-binding protein [Dehalococcoidia bacterium]|nr:ABC transporter substrate-binding protein [Dehalococcoidia bacterium]
MFRYDVFKGNRWAMVPATFALAVIVACGGAATPAAEPEQAAPTAPQAMTGQQAAPTEAAAQSAGSAAATAPPQQAQVAPTAVPAVTEAAPQSMTIEPAGKITMGQEEINIFSGHPAHSVNPQLFVISTAPVVEGLMQWNSNLEAEPLLTESWSISDDFATWTFNIRKGVQFHKGYGEMTAEDVVYSYSHWITNTKHARASALQRFWDHPEGSVQIVDSHTLMVNTGDPMPDVIMSEFHRVPSGIASWVVSKKQSDEIGIDAADKDIAATGPWEIVEHRPAQYWRMKAVQDHWRKTPYFAELEFQEIPEQSTRLAGFQTGNLDTFVMAFDSIPLVQEMEGAKLMQVPDQAAGEMLLHFHGGLYFNVGTPDQEAAYDPDLPWVSSNTEIGSPEWEQAKKVRQAMVKAIDVQTIVETLLQGYARRSPVGVGGYSYSSHRFPDIPPLEYDLEGAKALMAETGYGDEGFNITLIPALRGAPAEVEVAEAIAVMWEDIGIDVKLQNLPYGTYRPTVIGRTFNGATNHATSPSNTPARLYNALQNRGSFVRHTHPFLDDITIRAQSAVTLEDRTRLETEVGKFMYDESIYASLYMWNAVWAVGPNIDDKSWSENLFYGDIRNINGYEWIEPRR